MELSEIDRLRAAVVRTWRLGRMTAEEASEALGVPASILNAIAYSVGPPADPPAPAIPATPRHDDNPVDRRCVIKVLEAAKEIAGPRGPESPAVSELARATGYMESTVKWAVCRLTRAGMWPWQRADPAPRTRNRVAQGTVAEAVAMLREQHGRPPTAREVSDLCGMSEGAVRLTVKRLAAAGNPVEIQMVRTRARKVDAS